MPTRRVIPVLCLLAVCLAVPRAGAWGDLGHQVIGRIAMRHLSPAAAARVRTLLGDETLADATLWADAIKNAEHPDHEEGTGPWHYINIADGGDLRTLRRQEGFLLWAIDRDCAVLRDPAASPAARRRALRLLSHWIGDLHMPLHVGRAEDRGGNHTFITWRGQSTNLHYVWDMSLIDADAATVDAYLATLPDPTAQQLADWAKGDPADWGQEGVALRARVYDFGDAGDPKDGPVPLGDAYLNAQRPLVHDRLQAAGVRLATLLNQILAPEAPADSEDPAPPAAPAP